MSEESAPDYSDLVVPALLFSSSTSSEHSLQSRENNCKLILEGRKIPYLLQYVDVDADTMALFETIKESQEERELTLPAVCAGEIVLTHHELVEMNDEGRIGELQAAVADQSAKQVLDLEQSHEWEKGGNALHFEVMRCGDDLELLGKLIGVGVSPDHQDENGDTPLHTAIFLGKVKVVERLVAAGARTDIKNKHGNTPADDAKDLLAKSEGRLVSETYTQIAELLKPKE
mmetsp:Transcript_14926/g.47583  ORF Transcript_14926/g.47583 Transcript_14926/m.47583 type:complete len:230 (+) Transcript_14926:37-726(+)